MAMQPTFADLGQRVVVVELSFKSHLRQTRSLVANARHNVLVQL